MKAKLVFTIITRTLITLAILFQFTGCQRIIEIGIEEKKKELPKEIEEGFTMIDIYLENDKIHYVWEFDTELTREELQITDEDVKENRDQIIMEFKNDFEENPNYYKYLVDGMVYIYLNTKGEELYRVNIDLSEL